jgi:hypothetical protein
MENQQISEFVLQETKLVTIGSTAIIRNVFNNRVDIASVVEHFTQFIC